VAARALIAAVLAAACLGAVSAAEAVARTASPVTAFSRQLSLPPPPAFLVSLVRRSAAFLGDPRPDSAVYFLTRREQAVQASSGDSVNSNQLVYLVVLTGSFTGESVGPARRTTRPTGSVASYEIDAATGRETDFGLSSQPVAPSKLGRSADLLPYLTGAKTPACAAPDLRGRAGFGGATGSELGGLTVTNTATVACSLPADPRVSLTWRGHSLGVRQVAFPSHWLERMNSKWARPLRQLQPGRSAELVLQWWNWCGSRPAGNRPMKISVDLKLPGQIAVLRTPVGGAVTPPFCNAPPSTIRVSPFVVPS